MATKLLQTIKVNLDNTTHEQPEIIEAVKSALTTCHATICDLYIVFDGMTDIVITDVSVTPHQHMTYLFRS